MQKEKERGNTTRSLFYVLQRCVCTLSFLPNPLFYRNGAFLNIIRLLGNRIACAYLFIVRRFLNWV